MSATAVFKEGKNWKGQEKEIESLYCGPCICKNCYRTDKKERKKFIHTKRERFLQ